MGRVGVGRGRIGMVAVVSKTNDLTAKVLFDARETLTLAL